MHGVVCVNCQKAQLLVVPHHWLVLSAWQTKVYDSSEVRWVWGPGSDRTHASLAPGPNQARWTTKEVRWVVNERTIVVIANTTIAWKTVQLVRWSERREWCNLACQSARAPDSALAWVLHRSHLNRWDFAPHEPRPQTLTRIVSRVSRRTHLTSPVATRLCWLTPAIQQWLVSSIRSIELIIQGWQEDHCTNDQTIVAETLRGFHRFTNHWTALVKIHKGVIAIPIVNCIIRTLNCEKKRREKVTQLIGWIPLMIVLVYDCAVPRHHHWLDG